MGYFNAVFDTEMDSTAQNKKGRLLIPKPFFSFRRRNHMDRCMENKTDFTYFPIWHQTWSRIGAFWIPSKWAINIKEVEIQTRFPSDHSPVILQLEAWQKPTQWKLNTNLLLNEESKKAIKEEMEGYFKRNRWNFHVNCLRCK